jgi:hypothetical protein
MSSAERHLRRRQHGLEQLRRLWHALRDGRDLQRRQVQLS